MFRIFCRDRNEGIAVTTPLTPAVQKFVLHWGEMGTRWGVNRTVAQIHALLYLSERPLHADDLVAALGVARSNVSTSLRELQSWGIVRVVHVLGDRRDHFETLTDVWELFQIVLDERKRREIDPTMRLLRECLDEARRGRASRERDLVGERMQAMLTFFESTSAWYEQLRRLPRNAVIRFVKMGHRISKMIA
ncbi:MAG: MarR family transcriptional regulator [Phycisphaerales bacterium]|nr:MarR family transcriptional regulator [Phycisphaerales bacterium]